MDFEQYLQQKTGRSTRQIALDAEMTQSKLSRQLSGTSALTLDTLYIVATKLDLDFLEIAVEAGLINADYANQLRGMGDLSVYPDQELIDELQRRLEAGSKAIAEAESPFSAPTPADDREAAAREILEEELKKPDLELAAHRINPDDKPILDPKTLEDKARAALAEELEKDDLDLAAYRHKDGDELDYTEYN